MGHYYSEMNDSSPLYTTKVFTDKTTLAKGKKIMKEEGYWRGKSKVVNVEYCEADSERKWYVINCQGQGKYFITMGKYDFEHWGEKVQTITHTLDNLSKMCLSNNPEDWRDENKVEHQLEECINTLNDTMKKLKKIKKA